MHLALLRLTPRLASLQDLARVGAALPHLRELSLGATTPPHNPDDFTLQLLRLTQLTKLTW